MIHYPSYHEYSPVRKTYSGFYESQEAAMQAAYEMSKKLHIRAIVYRDKRLTFPKTPWICRVTTITAKHRGGKR